jgi:hypothetical protein
MTLCKLGFGKAAREMHLQMNQEKTKHMPVTIKDFRHSPSRTETGTYKFEIVHSFTYVRTEVS